MKNLSITTDAYAVEIYETISGAFAVTGPDGLRLTRSNFFTLDEAATAGLEIMLRVIGETGGCDSNAREPFCGMNECTVEGCTDELCVKKGI